MPCHFNLTVLKKNGVKLYKFTCLGMKIYFNAQIRFFVYYLYYDYIFNSFKSLILHNFEKMHEIFIKFCVFIIDITENNFYLGSDILSPLLFEIQNLGDSLPGHI